MTSASVRVAVVGCGYWGRNLVRNFAELGALAAIVDNSSSAAQELVETYGTHVSEFHTVLHDQSIDGVIIATPASQHYRLATEALNAGKHVFVEKPIALDVREAEDLVRMSERLGRRLMVGHLLQYHPAFVRLKELLVAGELGRLHYIYSNRLNFGKIRQEEDVLWSFAPHDISMILALVGDEPAQVDAMGWHYLHDTVADVTMTQLAFSGGQRAQIFVSWLHPFKEQKLVVVGSDGMAVFDDTEPWSRKLIVFKHRVDWRDGMPMPRKADGSPVLLENAEPLKAECRHFLDCISYGVTPRTDGREGVRVLSVLKRASDSMARATQGIELSRCVTNVSSPAARFPGVRIHESAYIDDDVQVGAGSAIWHFSHVLAHVRIGEKCVLGQNVSISPDVTIGARCKIQNNVSIYKGVTLEDGVFCGPSCVFTNVNNPRAEIDRKSEFRPTLVRRGASIGANATVVCGHTIGKYSFVAAGAVVTKDVADFALVAGNPAQRIGWMSRGGERLGPNLVCPRTGVRYKLIAPDNLVEVSSGAEIANGDMQNSSLPNE